MAALPTPVRFATYRGLIDCDPVLDDSFQLKIAETQDELEAYFSLLHDAYVAKRHHAPSSVRVARDAVPRAADHDHAVRQDGGPVVGTLSIVREDVFGFPMQSAFDITSVRAKEGASPRSRHWRCTPPIARPVARVRFP